MIEIITTPVRQLRIHRCEDVPTIPGAYSWWADLKYVRQLIPSEFLDLILPNARINIYGSVLIYVGIARRSLRQRLQWHIDQQHRPSAIRSGHLSTLRQTLSSVLCGTWNAEKTVNIFLDFLTVTLYTPEVEGDVLQIEEWERSQLKSHVVPLNIQNNNRPEVSRFRRYLTRLRREARQQALNDFG